MFSLLSVDEVKTFGLRLTINESTGEASSVKFMSSTTAAQADRIHSQQLLGFLVSSRVAVLRTVVLVRFSGLSALLSDYTTTTVSAKAHLVGSCASKEFVGE